MYDEKLKRELFKKIEKLARALLKLQEIENKSKLSFGDLIIKRKRARDLFGQIIDLYIEVEELIIDTKFFPLAGMTRVQQGILENMIEKKDGYSEKSIEKQLDFQLLSLKENMKLRLLKVKPLYLTVKIDPASRIYKLYQQAVNCYIYGSFEACSVLCRAISETVAKKYIERTEHGNDLYGRNRSKINAPSIGRILKELSVNKEIVDLYYEIGNCADEILHSKDKKAEEKEAYHSISNLQLFIKEFYKKFDFTLE